MMKYERYYSNLNNIALSFIKDNNLFNHIEICLENLQNYLNDCRIKYDIKLDFFEDFFSKKFRAVIIKIVCKNYDEYSYFYLWRKLDMIMKSLLPEELRSKIVIKLENEY